MKSIPSTKVQQLEKYVTSFHNDRDKGGDVLFTDEETAEEYTVKKQSVPLSSLKENSHEDDDENEDNEKEIQIDDI